MNLVKNPFLLFVTLFFSMLTVGATGIFAADIMSSAPVVSLQEMPLLRGVTWQKMTQDEKTAFVWGMGHIIVTACNHPRTGSQ